MKITSSKYLLYGGTLIAVAAAAWLGFLHSVTPTADTSGVEAELAAQSPEFVESQKTDVAQARPDTAVSEPLDRLPQSGVEPLSVRTQGGVLQSLDDFLEEATANGILPVEAASVFRQASSDSLRAGRELARAARSVARSADGAELIFDFFANTAAATEMHSQISAALATYVTSDQIEALLTLLSEAGESDPSLDMLKHHRQIIICPAVEEGRWQVSDRTYTDEGNLLTANKVFLGFDEDGELVWPEEYRVLLSE